MKFFDDLRKWAKENRIAAVDVYGNSLSYKELDDRSNHIAVELYNNYRNQSPIIIIGDKENDMLCAMYGCIKSGHPYIIVPSWFPKDKCEKILFLSKAEATISLSEKCEKFNVPCYSQNDINNICLQSVSYDYSKAIREEEIACIFFTSGSTGDPKGVEITLEGILSMEKWWSNLFDLNIASPKICNSTSYGFVASLQNVYSFMTGLGGCLYAVERETSKDFQQLSACILKINPHYLDCTPSFINLCMQNDEFNSQQLSNMRIVSVGGEALSEKIAKKILERFSNCELINGYGASEMTSGPIACRITAEMVNRGGAMPIGYISKDSIAFVVDENHQKIEDEDVQGELVVVSPMVAKGYLYDEEKTSRSFFVDEKGMRGYYTNDLVKIDKNGLITYFGRCNNMVKIGGYRVEMEEIESHLSQIEGIEACVVIPVYNNENVVLTCAFIITKNEIHAKMREILRIKKALGNKVPSYMIPQKYQFVTEFPKNNNGKIDRKELIEKVRINSE